MTTTRAITVSIDDKEVEELYIDLREAPSRAQFGVEKSMRRAKDLVTTRMKAEARGHRYLPRFPTAVIGEMLGRYEAQIGFHPIPGTQGKLASIILNGSVNNLPVYDFTNALTRSIPEIEEMFASAGEDAVLGSREA